MGWSKRKMQCSISRILESAYFCFVLDTYGMSVEN